MSQTIGSLLKIELSSIKWVIGVLVVCISGYYSLLSDIEEAKKLPKPAVTRKEFDLKDELIRETLKNNIKTIERLEEEINRLNDKVYILNKN